MSNYKYGECKNSILLLEIDPNDNEYYQVHHSITEMLNGTDIEKARMITTLRDHLILSRNTRYRNTIFMECNAIGFLYEVDKFPEDNVLECNARMIYCPEFSNFHSSKTIRSITKKKLYKKEKLSNLTKFFRQRRPMYET